MRSKIRYWFDSPVSFPRWMLSLKYLLFVILGLTGLTAGLPTLSIATPAWYEHVWGLGLVLSAGVATVSSLQPKWECVERWAAVGVVGLLASYWFSAFILFLSGDSGRGSFSVLLFIVTMLPLVRASSLFRVKQWFNRMFKLDKK